MYKLKDIFTLNLNSRGGVKLFNKIANKYNLRKEDRKDLMNVEVGSNNSNFEYWYIKYVPNSGAEQAGIGIQTYFRRGVARYNAFQGAVKLMKCTVWPPLTKNVYGMHAMEVLPIPTTLELDGITLTLDTTSYDSFILSMIKGIVGNIPDDVPEEELQAFINQMKEQYVEISKEEFEEIYDNAED